MKLFLKDIKNALNNENGGPTVEALIGIAVAMAVGTGLFVLGRYIRSWFDASSTEISKIEIARSVEA